MDSGPVSCLGGFGGAGLAFISKYPVMVGFLGFLNLGLVVIGKEIPANLFFLVGSGGGCSSSISDRFWWISAVVASSGSYPVWLVEVGCSGFSSWNVTLF